MGTWLIIGPLNSIQQPESLPSLRIQPLSQNGLGSIIWIHRDWVISIIPLPIGKEVRDTCNTKRANIREFHEFGHGWGDFLVIGLNIVAVLCRTLGKRAELFGTTDTEDLDGVPAVIVWVQKHDLDAGVDVFG